MADAAPWQLLFALGMSGMLGALQAHVKRRGTAAAAEAEPAMLPEQAEQERARQLALQKALQLVMRLEDALSLFSSNMVWHPVTLLAQIPWTQLAAGAVADVASVSRS